MSSVASNIKKAGSVLRNSFRSRNYSMFDIKENEQLHKSSGSGDSVKTPKEKFRQRTLESTSSSRSSGDEFDLDKPATDQKSISLKRSKVTQSMRDAVGTIRQVGRGDCGDVLLSQAATVRDTIYKLTFYILYLTLLLT